MNPCSEEPISVIFGEDSGLRHSFSDTPWKQGYVPGLFVLTHEAWPRKGQISYAF